MGFELQILGKSIFNTILKPNQCDKRTHLFFQWNCDYIKTTDGAQADWCGRIALDKLSYVMFSVISGASSPRGMWTITSRRAIDVPIRTHTHLVATTAANQKPNLFIEVTEIYWWLFYLITPTLTRYVTINNYISNRKQPWCITWLLCHISVQQIIVLSVVRRV